MQIVQPVYAQGLGLGNNVAKISDFESVFAGLVGAVLGLAAIVLFLMLILGGFKFVTSAGDPKAVDSAKKTLTYAIAGMVLIASAYLILRFIGVFTGFDLTNFVIVR